MPRRCTYVLLAAADASTSRSLAGHASRDITSTTRPAQPMPVDRLAVRMQEGPMPCGGIHVGCSSFFYRPRALVEFWLFCFALPDEKRCDKAISVGRPRLIESAALAPG